MVDAPEHYSLSFTRTLHDFPEGPTLPENNRPPAGSPFIVVVTGAGKGLGYGISVAYAKAGATGLCIRSRTQTDLDKLGKELVSIKSDIKVLSKICDIMKPEDVNALANTTHEAFAGQLDVVIANAGTISRYLPDGSLPQGNLNDDDFARVTNVDYLGSYHVAKYLTPLLLEAKSDTELLWSAQVCNATLQREGLSAYAVHPGEVVPSMTQHNSLSKGDVWDQILQTDVNLAGGFLTWLTNKRREWLNGRYLSVHWDVKELEKRKDEIVEGDKLKFKMMI